MMRKEARPYNVAVKIRISNDFSAYGNGNTFGLKQKTQFFQNNFCVGARYYGVNNRPIGENLPNRCKRAQFGHPDLTDLFPVSDSSRRRVVLAEERLGQALVCHVVLLTIFAGAGFVLKHKIREVFVSPIWEILNTFGQKNTASITTYAMFLFLG
jgi:hypothetical protein